MGEGCSSAGQVLGSSTCGPQDVISAEQAAFLSATMDEAALWFFSILGVIRASGSSLVLDRSSTTCSTTQFSFSYPSQDLSSGVPSADLVLYVTLRPVAGTTLAFAGACSGQRDAASGRPTAGFVNVNVARLKVGDAGLLMVLKHEIVHVLGFSPSMFSQFPSSPVSLIPASRRKSVYNIQVVKSPTVLSEVRRQTACATLEGAELENQGGVGTAGAHWEKTRFGGEFMVGSSSGGPAVFSRLTFALLLDSGWYAADLGNPLIHQSIPWGDKAGCDFAEQSCDSAAWKSLGGPYFCTEKNQGGCMPSRSMFGICVAPTTVAQSLPSQFAYFSGPQTAGSTDDDLSDFCPVWVDSNDCTNPADASLSPDGYASARGEEYTSTSRCLTSTLLKSSAGQFKEKLRPYGCYSVGCGAPAGYRVRVAQHWYDCPDGTDISIPYGGGFGGRITCPATSEACPLTPKNSVVWPTVTSVTPSSLRRAATRITVAGSGLSKVTKVDVAGVDCKVDSVTDSTIICDTASGDYSGESFLRVADSSGRGMSTLPGLVKIDTKASAAFRKAKEWLEGECFKNCKCWYLVAAGAAAFVLVTFALCCWCCKRRSRARRSKAEAEKLYRLQANTHYIKPEGEQDIHAPDQQIDIVVDDNEVNNHGDNNSIINNNNNNNDNNMRGDYSQYGEFASAYSVGMTLTISNSSEESVTNDSSSASSSRSS